MEAAVVRQFLGFFQDFLQLCQFDDWPNNDTSESEMKNALLISQHIEKCLDKLQRRDIINEFLKVMSSEQDTSNIVFKNCFTDPPRYVLKKIINSKSKITQMDVGFRLFCDIFTEDRLEKCLTEIILEAASKETLLRKMSEIPRENILLFKSIILLNELNHCEDSKVPVMHMLENCTQDVVDLLIISLLNKDLKYHDAVNNIVNTFIVVMLKRDHRHQKFWTCLLRVDEQNLIKLCLNHADLFKIIVKGLLDSGKLLKEQMSAEFFYINLTYSELVGVVQKICKDACLRIEFEDIVRSSNAVWEFWENMLPS